jgi:hypothetical protein
MAGKPNISGGGAATNRAGLTFEDEVDIVPFIDSQDGYAVVHVEHGDYFHVLFEGTLVAKIYKKYALYRILLPELGIDYTSILSKRLLPDNSLFVIVDNRLIIIEVKNQNKAGSVDEKLQTCGFKLRQYRRLMKPANIDIEFIYILNDWFKRAEYRDTLEYIREVGCDYYFGYIPIKRMGLPFPRSEC